MLPEKWIPVFGRGSCSQDKGWLRHRPRRHARRRFHITKTRTVRPRAAKDGKEEWHEQAQQAFVAPRFGRTGRGLDARMSLRRQRRGENRERVVGPGFREGRG